MKNSNLKLIREINIPLELLDLKKYTSVIESTIKKVELKEDVFFVKLKITYCEKGEVKGMIIEFFNKTKNMLDWINGFDDGVFENDLKLEKAKNDFKKIASMIHHSLFTFMTIELFMIDYNLKDMKVRIF